MVLMYGFDRFPGDLLHVHVCDNTVPCPNNAFSDAYMYWLCFRPCQWEQFVHKGQSDFGPQHLLAHRNITAAD